MKNSDFRRVSASGARLAQLAEHYLDTVGVTSSSLVPRTILRTQLLPEPAERIVEFIHHAFLQRNDGVVGDGDVLRADLGAAFGDVAEADALRLLQFRQPVFGVERVHFQRGGINQKARADEFLVLVVVAQHVADVLAEETFDALAEFLHAVHVLLLHAPGAVRRVGLCAA